MNADQTSKRNVTYRWIVQRSLWAASINFKVPIFPSSIPLRNTKISLFTRAVFTKVIRVCVGFAFLLLVIGLKTRATFLTNKKLNQKRSWVVCSVFPCFVPTTRINFEFWSAHWIVWVLYDCPKWLLWFWSCDTQLKTAVTQKVHPWKGTLTRYCF